jgi:ABC-type transport system involved in multi-copper enzyme maturation permease subunit
MIFWARGFYLAVLFLAIVLLCTLELELRTPAQFLEAMRAGLPVPTSKAASFASHFFLVLLGAELMMVVLLTPAYVAGAIAEDRERRIIDYLLASDLSNGEIVLGKWLSRLAHVGSLLLTGLPLLLVAQVMGGVPAVFLLTGLVVALMTMASLGALSILESICNSQPHRAILNIYLGVGFYLLLSTGFTLTLFLTGSARPSSVPERAGMICWSGNPLLPLVRLFQDRDANDWPNGILIEALTDCAVINGMFCFGCLGLAIYRLRSYLRTSPLSREERLALRLQQLHAGLKVEAARKLAASSRPHGASTPDRPPLNDRPILWKELYVESAPLRLPREVQNVMEAIVRVLTVVFGSIFPLLLLLKFILVSPSADWWIAVLWISSLLLVLLLAGTALRAGGCLSGERERNTLDALLGTTLENAIIINGKWLASLLTMRPCAIALVTVWVASTLLGVLDWRALPLLILAAGSWLCFVASLGVFCSLLCRTTWRATSSTLGILLAIGAFPWLMDWEEWTPVGMLRLLMDPIQWENRLTSGAQSPEVARVLAAALNLGVLATLLLWWTHSIFPRITGRK